MGGGRDKACLVITVAEKTSSIKNLTEILKNHPKWEQQVLHLIAGEKKESKKKKGTAFTLRPSRFRRQSFVSGLPSEDNYSIMSLPEYRDCVSTRIL